MWLVSEPHHAIPNGTLEKAAIRKIDRLARPVQQNVQLRDSLHKIYNLRSLLS